MFNNILVFQLISVLTFFLCILPLIFFVNWFFCNILCLIFPVLMSSSFFQHSWFPLHNLRLLFLFCTFLIKRYISQFHLFLIQMWLFLLVIWFIFNAFVCLVRCCGFLEGPTVRSKRTLVSCSSYQEVKTDEFLLSYTPEYTHTRTLSVSLSACLSLSLCLSLSYTHRHTDLQK